jgi:hypothetical protein
MEPLNEDWQRKLIAQPESGMGYQDVAIKLRNGETRYGTAFNAEFLLYSGESATLLERISEPFQRLLMLEEKQLSLGEEILSLRVLRRETDVSIRVRESASSKQSSPGASEAAIQELQEDEKFKRFSAYANDRRVTVSGALVPGTYATTEEDAKHVKTGRDAVKRYALPNPKPAVYVFTIEPPLRTKLKRGVALPAYGQPGGRCGSYFCERVTRQDGDGPRANSAMTIRLPEKWTRFLVRQPENGMGYQRVDVRLANNREIKDAVVFNAEEIELPDDCAHSEIEDIQLHR